MKRKKARKIKNSLSTLLENFPPQQPPGEDFFYAKITFESPHDPCWHEVFSITGPWKVVSRATNLIIDKSLHHFGRTLDKDAPAHQPQIHKIDVFQADQARAELALAHAEELRYQQQRSSQPLN